jgi:predicted peptidase
MNGSKKIHRIGRRMRIDCRSYVQASAILGMVAVLMALGGCSTSRPWGFANGQQPRQFERVIAKSVGANFLLYLPEEYSTEQKRWPLIIFLHGSGERGNDLERVKINGPPNFLEHRKDFQFIVASPQLPDSERWSSDVVVALVDELCDHLAVDTNRIYLTGLSLGGYATWDIACDFPGRFAAIAPVCGVGDADLACRLKQVPVWAFHGAIDPVVPLKDDEEMVKAVKACGGDIRFTVYPNVGHEAWVNAYADPELYSWFLGHRRHD